MVPYPHLLLVLACTDGDLTNDDPSSSPPPARGPEPESLCRISAECYGSVLDDPKTPCALTVTTAEGQPVYEGSAGFELRGRSSLYFPKPQYAIELRTHSELPVWPGATWRYLDGGQDPGEGWMLPGHDDAAWIEGSAPAGYGTDWLQTEVREGLTTYFRKEFDLASLAEISWLQLGIKHDDGAVVYLNGAEILRDNLPLLAGPDTPAHDVRDSTTWLQVEVDPQLLVEGPNLLAVEVHQAEEGMGDLRFDLYLEAAGEDRSVDLLGMGGEEDWILNGQYVDRALVRNRFAYDVYQSFGGNDRYAPELRFCELELNGEYQGVYTLGEKIERDDDRLDIGKGEFAGDSFIVKLDDPGGFHDNALGYGSWELVYPDVADAEAAAAVSYFLDGFEAAALGPDPADPDTGVFAWVDLASAVDWVILQELTKNHDGYLLSVHLYKDEGAGKMAFVPWDFDLAMGEYPVDWCGAEGWVPRQYWDVWSGEVRDLELIRSMTEVPAFQEALVARWRELREGPLAEEVLLEHLAGYHATLEPAIEANSERWPIDEITFYAGGDEDELCPVSSYDEARENLQVFVRDRLVWIDTWIDGYADVY